MTNITGCICKNVTHHIETDQLMSAICFSFSKDKYGILIVYICKNTVHATSKLEHPFSIFVWTKVGMLLMK